MESTRLFPKLELRLIAGEAHWGLPNPMDFEQICMAEDDIRFDCPVTGKALLTPTDQFVSTATLLMFDYDSGELFRGGLCTTPDFERDMNAISDSPLAIAIELRAMRREWWACQLLLASEVYRDRVVFGVDVVIEGYQPSVLGWVFERAA